MKRKNKKKKYSIDWDYIVNLVWSEKAQNLLGILEIS